MAWQALPSLKVDLAYSLIYEDLPDIHVSFTSEAPTNQLSLQANWQLTDALTVDFWGRYVDKLRAIYTGDILDSAYPIDDYFTIDLQLRYSPSQDLEIALIGQNLLQKSHEEYVQEYYTLPAEVERGVYMKATYLF